MLNNDPALDTAREHDHGHMHHAPGAAHDDNVTYSKDTTAEPSIIPAQDPLDDNLRRRAHPEKNGHYDEKNGALNYDPEKGSLSPIGASVTQEEDPKRRGFSGFYKKYRVFFHAAIWLLFTGYACFPYECSCPS